MGVLTFMIKKIAACASGFALLCGLCAVGAYASPSSSKSVKPVTSQAQLDLVLAKSIKQQSLPSNLTPSLTKLANDSAAVQGSDSLHKSCDPYVYNNEASNPAPCWYGSTSATRVVVIWGDSFVGNWMPALNIAGKDLGFRVAEFSFPGCNTAFVNGAAETGFDQNEVNACAQFHTNLPKSVNKLSPIAVIAADGALSWGTVGNVQYVAGLKTAFNEMSTSADRPARILLGTGPHLSEPAPTCLATHPSDINRCNLSYSSGSDLSITIARDQSAVKAADVELIPTFQWICRDDTCPAVIGNIDVYADEDHLTTAISKYLSVLLEKSIAPLLGTAST